MVYRSFGHGKIGVFAVLLTASAKVLVLDFNFLIIIFIRFFVMCQICKFLLYTWFLSRQLNVVEHGIRSFVIQSLPLGLIYGSG